MPDTVITLAMLDAKRPCKEQRNLFAELFLNGTPKTRRAALAAARKYADKFDWTWAAGIFLHAPARAEYNKVRVAALAEYDKVCAPAFVNAWFNQQENL